MTLIAEKTYTAEEFLDNPNRDGHELVDGHLRERAMSERSSLVAGKILRLLGNEADKAGDVSVYPNDLGYQCFPDAAINVRFADVSLIRNSRKKEIRPDPGFMPIPADLVVEVLSPNDRIKEVADKVTEYLGAGFGVVWVVDPYLCHVHVYGADGSVR
ncbi:MAG TPA: Uma2 family endonuclease, partial [Humisphaera sp.]|nr:Uma2 family endonuclease [Humisphaera sp.]